MEKPNGQSSKNSGNHTHQHSIVPVLTLYPVRKILFVRWGVRNVGSHQHVQVTPSLEISGVLGFKARNKQNQHYKK